MDLGHIRVEKSKVLCILDVRWKKGRRREFPGVKNSEETGETSLKPKGPTVYFILYKILLTTLLKPSLDLVLGHYNIDLCGKVHKITYINSFYKSTLKFS